MKPSSNQTAELLNHIYMFYVWFDLAFKTHLWAKYSCADWYFTVVNFMLHIQYSFQLTVLALFKHYESILLFSQLVITRVHFALKTSFMITVTK